MNALFLTPESPYPTVGGGPLRSASILEYLKRRYSVHTILFREAGAADPSSEIEDLDVIELPHHSRSSAARVARNSVRLVRNRPPLQDRFSGFEAQILELTRDRRYDVAIVEHFWCAGYIDQLRPRTTRAFLDLHNVESAWHRSLARSERKIRAVALDRFADASLASERRLFPKFDGILTTSSHDASLVKEIASGVNAIVYPNALPEIPLPRRLDRPEIVFSGNLEYQPNIGAVKFFHQSVWPLLKPEYPDLRWRIVGKNPRAIAGIVANDAGVELTGPMDDAVLTLAESQVAIVPLLAGSGTRIKILEAWAAATPVVSTSLGAEGLEARDGEHLLIADSPALFANAISSLLASEAERRRIGIKGRELYRQQYMWPVVWNALERLFGNDY